MEENQEQIKLLILKLETLLKKQEQFGNEITEIKREINALKVGNLKTEEPKQTIIKENIAQSIPKNEVIKENIKEKASTKRKTDFEKFIGENLISKIGIAITVIGVAIGAKYAIDHELISPLTRIILGYLVGLGLLGFAFKLKQKYEKFSAVLLSGSMAILYFITYAGYSFYDLFPQMVAFSIMIVFTAFTVFSAILYNQQIIAHIGLVGAYAIPLLLSDGGGKIAVLFTYMAIINIGILIIAMKKYWKSLYYSSFGITWLMVISWYSNSYNSSEHFMTGLVFTSIFFLIFYVNSLAYKFIKNEKFELFNISLLLINSFIFYGIGYAIISSQEIRFNYLGIFTLTNAFIHFIVSIIIYKKQLADKNLIYLVTGLVLVFLTLTIPVQLEGKWVTMLWAFEAALLFWIGRTKQVKIYEVLSYPLILLGFFSLFQDWVLLQFTANINSDTEFAPLLNITFFTSLLSVSAYGIITFINHNPKHNSTLQQLKWIPGIFKYIIPIIFFTTLYYTFRIEISFYFKQLFANSEIQINTNGENYLMNYFDRDINRFGKLWKLNYTMFFISILSLINIKKVKNTVFGYSIFVISLITMLTFLTEGLYEISELRESYLNDDLNKVYTSGSFNLIIRYISILFFSIMVYFSYVFIQKISQQKWLQKAFHLSIHLSIIWILSSELIQWLEMASSVTSYKLGLSILWGIYSLMLIVIGIWKKQVYLRVGAICLFAITLIKLFVYDISHLNTISKTIVFISLGILLLIISFLYNKYRHIISDEPKE